ncbi:MAG TPA: hypothetical protein VGG30_10360, partial [Pirellulales bacterium]
EHTDDPALRLLLGFHYYYLGYSKQALTELDKTLQLEPRDPIARQLRNVVAAKLGLPAAPAPPNAEGPGAPGAPAGASSGKSL